MALRVLLADESSTIKKVMQLALSDYGVEVKSVPVGLDVLQVTKSFKPDIIFADVLLTKRSGYEVCADIKNDSQTQNIPVVLMWSGFMEIDELKAQECRADRRLEKPFDADLLRSIVSDLVPKTSSNPISEFVTFPDMPEFDESPMAQEDSISKMPEMPSKKSEDFNKAPILSSSESKSEDVFDSLEKFDALKENESFKELESINSIDEFSDISSLPEINEEDFLNNIPEIEEDVAFGSNLDEDISSNTAVTNPRISTQPDFSLEEDEADEGGWSHQDLTKFKIQIPSESEDLGFTQKFKAPLADTLDDSSISIDEVYEEVPTVQQQAKANAQGKSHSKMDIAPDMVEKIIREEAREVIEAICWKIIPDIAERVIREEIKKILKDTEKSI